jgi:hypothetical protein
VSVVDGKAAPSGIPRQSIDGQKVPNCAVFIRRTALEFLQILFKLRGEGSYHYDPDDTKTEIQIGDVHAVDLEAIAKRPAIIAVRGPLSWQPTSIGSTEHRDVPTGRHTFSELLAGSIAISCISREGVEAEQIAHLVFNSFKFFRPALTKYGLFSIKSLSMGGELLVEAESADDRTTIVPVYLSATVQDRWTLENTTARKLEKIVFEQEFSF